MGAEPASASLLGYFSIPLTQQSTLFSPETYTRVSHGWPGRSGSDGDREERGSNRGSWVMHSTLLRICILTRLFHGIETPYPQPCHLTKTTVISQFCSCLPPSPLHLKKKSTSCKAKIPYVRSRPSFCFVEFFWRGRRDHFSL